MKKSGQEWQKPKVVFQPGVHTGLQQGINQIVDAIRPTLGPYPRLVMYDRTVGTTGRLPEMLDNGGTIARRIIQVADRDADVGAMLIRQMLWQLHEKVGDGTATAAVLFQAIYNQGLQFIAAGGNAMRLRGYLEDGLRVIVSTLDGMAFRLRGKEQLAHLAETICYDAELGKMLGEIFDIIGEYGRLEIRTSNTRQLEREYVEGMYWESGLLSRTMINNQERQRAELENPVILMTDMEIQDPKDLIPPLSVAVRSEIGGLVIVARKLSDVALGMILANKRQQRIKVEVVAAKVPGVSSDAQRAALADMAVLTGGRALFQKAGDSLRRMRPTDLGRARRVWVDKNNLGIVGGKGDPRKLREHIASLRTTHASIEDATERAKVQKRIGKLMGGSATLRIGGMTKSEVDFEKTLAERTTEAMRGAMREGVLPGGGVSLLACQPILRERLEQSSEPEERAAYRILINALEVPIRTLVRNAGFENAEVFAEIRTAGPGHYGLDVKTGQVVDVIEAGILDAASVLKGAVHSAVSTAALALTTDVIVHRADAPEALGT